VIVNYVLQCFLELIHFYPADHLDLKDCKGNLFTIIAVAKSLSCVKDNNLLISVLDSVNVLDAKTILLIALSKC
jgi:hypothetical protein